MRQLTSGLGVTPAAADRHFASLEDLLLELARIGFSQQESRFAEAFDISQPPSAAAQAQARLRRLARAYRSTDSLPCCLCALDAATRPADMNRPGWDWHPLKGSLSGHWSVSVNGNWRLTFSFET